jgi:hypothetical protein
MTADKGSEQSDEFQRQGELVAGLYGIREFQGQRERFFAGLYGIGGATLGYLQVPAERFMEKLGTNADSLLGKLSFSLQDDLRTNAKLKVKAAYVLLLAAVAAAYDFDEKRREGREKGQRYLDPWESLYGLRRKTFRGLRPRLKTAAKGEASRRQIASLARDLRKVHASLSGPSELAGKLDDRPKWISTGRRGYPDWYSRRYVESNETQLYGGPRAREPYEPSTVTGYPDLARLADRIDSGESLVILAPDLRRARGFIVKECLSDTGRNSPEKLTISTAIERSIADEVRQATNDGPDHFGLAELLELVEVTAIGHSHRFNPNSDNAGLLRARIHKLASKSKPVPAFNVMFLGAQYLEASFA